MKTIDGWRIGGDTAYEPEAEDYVCLDGPKFRAGLTTTKAGEPYYGVFPVAVVAKLLRAAGWTVSPPEEP